MLRPGGFYALGVGLSIATCSWTAGTRSPCSSCFYALGVGLSIATTGVNPTDPDDDDEFLCPRRRAEHCDEIYVSGDDVALRCFYALGVGLSIATVRINLVAHWEPEVSMPSASG